MKILQRNKERIFLTVLLTIVYWCENIFAREFSWLSSGGIIEWE